MGVVKLLGRHIYYSASPAMQSAAFAALELDHRYELADVPVDGLPGAVATLRDDDCLGANVTVPHKGALVALLDEVNPLGRRAQAVNTIVHRRGRLIGSNTDIPAIADEIKRLRPEPRNAVVLGAGGAARAVCLALEMTGMEQATLVSRAGREGAVAWDQLPELLTTADLLINATPVGTDSEDTPVPAALLHQPLAVLDLVYRPSPTRLVSEAREAGLPASGGAGVLLGQGWRSLEAWLGKSISRGVLEVMAQALREELGEDADV
ncbi:shikimate dehydrogenase [soil metagenome]